MIEPIHIVNKRLHLELSPGIPLTMWVDFWLHSVSAPLCRLQCGRQKQKFAVRWCSNFFINLAIFIVHSIQFFILGSKISKSLKLNQNWRFYTMFSRGIIFFWEEGFLISYQECEENVRNFLSSFWLVPHNVSGIPATLWLTMWMECEESVSLNEDA